MELRADKHPCHTLSEKRLVRFGHVKRPRRTMLVQRYCCAIAIGTGYDPCRGRGILLHNRSLVVAQRKGVCGSPNLKQLLAAISQQALAVG
jgi:hypothetical protein